MRPPRVRRLGGVRGADRAARPGYRLASNFAILGVAEVVCRALSVFVTLTLAQRLGAAGYGRIEFAFNIIYWMVLVVRDCFEMIVTREIARHPRLTTAIVNRVLAVKFSIAATLYLVVVGVSLLAFPRREDAFVLASYGLMLLTTALGLDFVFRASERVGLVAVSLLLRTLVYSGGVLACVWDAGGLVAVPLWLVGGEAAGICLVWLFYLRRYGRVRPVLAWRFLTVFLKRGRSVLFIHLGQATLLSADLLMVGLFRSWEEIGHYGAPHRMVSAVLAFSMIFQQVIFPALSRGWRDPKRPGNPLSETAVRLLMMTFLPVAIGGSLLAGSLIALLLPPDYQDAVAYLRIGVWRVPLFSLAFFYQSLLVAMSREAVGFRLLLGGSIAASPLILGSLLAFGPIGACSAVLVIGGLMVGLGYGYLRREGRAPAWHHHVGRPLLAATAMAPVCLALANVHCLAAVAGGGATYLLSLLLLGGFRDLGMPNPVEGWRGGRGAPAGPVPVATES